MVVCKTLVFCTLQCVNWVTLYFVSLQWRHRGPVNSPHKWPVTRKMLPFDDVIMSYSVFSQISMAGCFVKQLETAATDLLIVSFAKAGSLEYVMKNEMIVKNTLSWIYPLHVSFKIESPFCNRNYGYIWVKKSSKLPEGTDTVLADRLECKYIYIHVYSCVSVFSTKFYRTVNKTTTVGLWV